MRQVKRAITAKQRENAIGGKAGKKGEITRAPVKATARVKTVLLPPIWTGHADFTNPFEFSTFMRTAEGLGFDVMMEGQGEGHQHPEASAGPIALCAGRGRPLRHRSIRAEELDRQERELEQASRPRMSPT
jgi:hypothetical protein